MKKYLIMAMAAAAITSCSQDEVMEIAQKQAISFKDAFVENATRAAIDGSYTNAKKNLGSFQVWGTTADNATATAVNIFNGVEVKATGEAGSYEAPWSYSDAYTQYWIEGNHYNFVAIAEGNYTMKDADSNGNDLPATKVLVDGTNMPKTIQISAANAQRDVLYAANPVGEYTNTTSKTVEFTFNHILSKAKFTAKVAENLDSKYYYTVSNIQILEAAKASDYTIESKTWSKATETYTVEFGHIMETENADFTAKTEPSQLTFGEEAESNWDRLLIPETINKIKFDVKLYTDNGLVNSYTQEIEELALTIEGGKAYNFVFTLPVPGDPIKFTVKTITEWDTTHDDYTQDITNK